MTTLVCKIVLFLSSYIPLFVIVIVKHGGRSFWWTLIPLILIIVGGLGLFGFFKAMSSEESEKLTAINVHRKDSEVIAYVFAYIFPFLGVDVDKTENVASLLILFIVIMVLYVSSSMIHVNPVLNLLQYHVYEVRLDENGRTATVITRRSRLVNECSIDVVSIGDDLLLERKRNK